MGTNIQVEMEMETELELELQAQTLHAPAHSISWTAYVDLRCF